MLRRRFVSLLTLLCVVLGLSGVVYAQMEAGDRGIAPIDSSGTLEITGIHVDVTGKDAQSARYEGWRQAQRLGFKAFWAKTHNRPVSQAPTVAGFDARRARQLDRRRARADRAQPLHRRPWHPVRPGALGRAARRWRRRSPVGADAAGAGHHHRRHGHDGRAAQPVAEGVGGVPDVAEPDRLCAGQRAGDRSAARQCGAGGPARPRLVAQHHRPLRRGGHISSRRSSFSGSIPGGPAMARFIGYHGPDKQPVGTFTISGPGGREHIADHAGRSAAHGPPLRRRARRRPAGARPEPRHPRAAASAGSGRRGAGSPSRRRPWTYQVQIVSPDVNIYNFAMAHIRTTSGVDQVVPVSINPGGVSYVNVTYRGDLSVLRALLVVARLERSSRTAMCCACRPVRAGLRRFRRRLNRGRSRLRRSRSRRRRRTRRPSRREARNEKAGGPDRASARLAADAKANRGSSSSAANREAFDHFRHWSMWPVKATVLTGPRRSGRTLLARTFAERVGGRADRSGRQPRRGRGVPRLERGAGHGLTAGHGG